MIVDLGPDVSRADVEIVLEACNKAISGGICVPRGLERDVEARAVAVARLDAERSRMVRIEVQLGSPSSASPSTAPSWLLREIEFSASDPARERWRSVGLAIATLVGEGEREREEAAALAPEASAAPATEAPEPAADADVANASVAPEASVGGTDAPVPGETHEAITATSERAVFLGIGVQTGPGFGTGPWRVGADARMGWVASSGWQLLGTVGYALRASEQTFTASWLTAHAGFGHRASLSRAVSAGASVMAGVQRMAFDASAAGVSRSNAVWNPSAAVGVDTLWVGSGGFVGWAAIDARTVGRRSRLHIDPELGTVTSLPIDVTASLGAGWWLF